LTVDGPDSAPMYILLAPFATLRPAFNPIAVFLHPSLIGLELLEYNVQSEPYPTAVLKELALASLKLKVPSAVFPVPLHRFCVAAYPTTVLYGPVPENAYPV